MVLFSCSEYLFHNIQKGLKDDEKWALGILESGERNVGIIMYTQKIYSTMYEQTTTAKVCISRYERKAAAD